MRHWAWSAEPRDNDCLFVVARLLDGDTPVRHPTAPEGFDCLVGRMAYGVDDLPRVLHMNLRDAERLESMARLIEQGAAVYDDAVVSTEPLYDLMTKYLGRAVYQLDRSGSRIVAHGKSNARVNFVGSADMTGA